MRKIKCTWIDGITETYPVIEWDKGKITAVTHSQASGDLIGMPALIDVHTHGFRGFSSEAPAEDLRRLAQAYAQRPFFTTFLKYFLNVDAFLFLYLAR